MPRNASADRLDRGRAAPVRPGWRWLLLSLDPVWPEAARREIARHGGGTLELATSPQEALNRVVAPASTFTHLLIEPVAAGPALRDLLGVSVGEVGSHVELLLLGDLLGLSGLKRLRHARTPAQLTALLRQPAGDPAELPPLPASEIAVGFRPDALECRFQPIVRLSDRRVVGMETLVRMQHPQRGTIGPDQFIPQIERSGLSLRLTEAVAERAMREVEPAFLDAHDLSLTINLPLDVLLFPEALHRIDGHRRSSGVPVGRILLELTESRPVTDLGSLAVAMERWRQAGYRMAIDDIGPEMLHQQELFDLPFDVVKLDKQIVLRSEHDPSARSYLQRTVDKAHSRSLSVIAEGIENAAMWRRMHELGVEHAQGFLVARAMPASALPRWLQAWSAQSGLPPDREPT